MDGQVTGQLAQASPCARYFNQSVSSLAVSLPLSLSKTTHRRKTVSCTEQGAAAGVSGLRDSGNNLHGLRKWCTLKVHTLYKQLTLLQSTTVPHLVQPLRQRRLVPHCPTLLLLLLLAARCCRRHNCLLLLLLAAALRAVCRGTDVAAAICTHCCCRCYRCCISWLLLSSELQSQVQVQGKGTRSSGEDEKQQQHRCDKGTKKTKVEEARKRRGGGEGGMDECHAMVAVHPLCLKMRHSTCFEAQGPISGPASQTLHPPTPPTPPPHRDPQCSHQLRLLLKQLGLSTSRSNTASIGSETNVNTHTHIYTYVYNTYI